MFPPRTSQGTLANDICELIGGTLGATKLYSMMVNNMKTD
jgi:hypothetical protein